MKEVSKMNRFIWTLKNILKISIWIFILVLMIGYFGKLWGIIFYTILGLFWNLVLTIITAYRLSGRLAVSIIWKTIFTSYFYLPIIVYGCYCSPKYGYKHSTNNLIPIDGLDEACKDHDIAMFVVRYERDEGLISERESLKIQNKGDWHFIKAALTSRNYANGIYLIGLIFGFTIRIIIRYLKLIFTTK